LILDFGIFVAFCISNWFLVYFFIYTVRVRGWSFGFGYITNGFEKLVKKIKGSKKSSE
jgi:ATP-binding cassette, subfamily G (WHITE), member 2, SNQ2